MPVPKIVVTAGLMAAQVAMGMARKIKGQRLGDTKVSLADYGTPIPRPWGKVRLSGQTIWAERLREKKTTSKTKGGKYQEYKYFGSWGDLLCDVPIDAVAKIIMDKHPVYDRTGTGPISIGAFFAARDGIKLQQGKNYRVYDGTQTAPDPRIEAWCEDRYGADTCPAYTGSAYVVFEEVPLEKFGNRKPLTEFLVINNSVDAFPVDTRATTYPLQRAQFSPDFTRLYLVDIGDAIQVWDVPSRTALSSFPTANTNAIGTGPGALYGRVLDGGGQRLLEIGPDGGDTALTDVFAASAGDVFYVGGLICLTALLTQTLHYSGDPALGVLATSRSFSPNHYFEDNDGNAWAVGEVAGLNKVGFAQMPYGSEHLVDTTTTGAAYAMCNEDGKFLTWQNGKLFIVDPDTWTAGSATNAATGAPDLAFRNVQPQARSIWLSNAEYDATDGSLIRSVTIADWGSFAGDKVYDPINHALISGSGAGIAWLYLDRIDSDGVTLADVVDDVSEWCGLTSQDTSALTQTVLGYSVTQGTGKDMIEPLLDMHDVDARPHDFGVQFLPRGTAASGATLLTEDFVREGERYTVTIQQDTDLPLRIVYNFADEGKDQQANTAEARRSSFATDSTREETVDLSTYVDTPDGAQQKADRHLRRIWNSRERAKLSLTAQQLALEPGDVRTISLDGITRNVKLDRLTITPTSLECEFVRDETSFSLLNDRAGGTMDGRDPEAIFIPGPTKGFVIDAPLVEDAHNDVNPVLYFAAGDYNVGNWPGASIMRGDDGTYDDLYGYVESTSDATWGTADEALATANPWLWDRGNTLDCTIYGTLSNATEAEIDDDTTLNLIALGQDGRWEYLQFTTASLTGTNGAANTYTLSGFKRGRRGTEINVGNHEAGDLILMLSAAMPEEIGTDEIGNDMSFKIQSAGRNIDAAPANDLTYDGNSLKPYAPARIVWSTDGTDMFGEIIRRTRIGGSWTGGSTVPLGENSEEYEIDIMDGADVVRTIAVTGTNLFTYTAAQLSADGFTLSALPDFNAYQMSDAAGRGFALAA